MAFIDINLVLAQPFFLCSLVFFLVRTPPTTTSTSPSFALPTLSCLFAHLSLPPTYLHQSTNKHANRERQWERVRDSMAHHMLSDQHPVTKLARLFVCCSGYSVRDNRDRAFRVTTSTHLDPLILSNPLQSMSLGNQQGESDLTAAKTTNWKTKIYLHGPTGPPLCLDKA